MSQAWPFEEAKKLINRRRDGQPVVFETGYGPSGAVHAGTLCEVLRTSMVRHAYTVLTDLPSRLIVFSDDADGMRKIPENIPNQEMLKPYLDVTLTRVPDPFGCCESFAHHNNAMLRSYLDRFEFDYEFRSATEMYRTDEFNGGMRLFHLHHDMIRDIILPTLGPDRAATYSPFMPIEPETGRVFQTKILDHDIDGERLCYLHPDTNEPVWTSILDGACKLQWKADWAMRWFVQEVDYEMSGKDLIDSVTLSTQIVESLGWKAPVGFSYEMFLDEHGHKISKSLGNGLTIDEWLRYGPKESLAYYLYREPRKAKKLHKELVPRAIDEYWRDRQNYWKQTEQQRLGNPVYHVHSGEIPSETLPVTFGLLLNLIGILGDTDEETVWGYVVDNYAPDAGEELRELIPYALAYHRDHLSGSNVRRAATNDESLALTLLADELANLPSGSSAEDIQFVVYEVGKRVGYADRLRDWFKVVYEIVFGSSEGPRLGTFIAVYGVDAFVVLLRDI